MNRQITIKEYIEATKVYDMDRTKTESLDIIQEYNKQLLCRFPWLTPCDNKNIRLTDSQHSLGYDYTYTILDDMPDGWRIAFGEALCTEIHSELERFNYVDEYRIIQIKEKFGSLRWYDNGEPAGDIEENFEIVTSDDIKYFDYDHFVYKYFGQDDDGCFMYKVYKKINPCYLHSIISKYEELSAKICIDCGEPATWESTGWICPYCDKCKEKYPNTEFVSISE